MFDLSVVSKGSYESHILKTHCNNTEDKDGYDNDATMSNKKYSTRP